ncbi:MAG TPA: glycosyltransferase family 2 protein [Candidatus Saccharimonas sp.]|nr:glycosyltransferase family 2 protein [Candidatus Saccharimonas sp.]
MKSPSPQLSVVIPAHNEDKSLPTFYAQLHGVLQAQKGLSYEVIFVDDGSTDDTRSLLIQFAKQNDNVRLICFPRNFGKEAATSAGIQHARGEGILMMDADGQNPPELIPTFLQKWRSGARVVVGVRTANQKEGWIKRYGSKLFYALLKRMAHSDVVPRATDFRLIDRTVQQEFNSLTERNRMTRGLIDWLGYERATVPFVANPRVAGEASYKITKLFRLAINSFVSLTLAPLYAIAWAGGFITLLSLLSGLFVIIEQLVLHDPLDLKITGTAMLALLILFLVGLVLMSQGLMVLYISHIHAETQNRPLYIVDHKHSIRLEKPHA